MHPNLGHAAFSWFNLGMATIGKQVKGGLKDVGKAVTVDAAEGVVEASKDIVGGLSGGIVGSDRDRQQTEESGDPELEALKVQKERARRKRLQEVQGELQQVLQEKQAEKEQVAQVEERHQEQQEMQEEESRAVKAKKWIMQKAKRGGGTGETARQKQ